MPIWAIGIIRAESEKTSTCTVAGCNKGVSPLGDTVPDSNRRTGFVLVFQGRDALVTTCNQLEKLQEF